MHFIEKEAKKLIKEYKTNDPYEICSAMGIQCIRMDMPSDLNGFCYTYDGIKRIYINNSLPKFKQKLICIHELAHLIFHENYNYIFILEHTYFCLDRYDKEVEFFVACFLIPDVSALFQYEGITLGEIAYNFNVPKEYVELRFEYYKSKDCSLGFETNLFNSLQETFYY